METEAFLLRTLKGSQLQNYTGFSGISILADNYWQGLIPRDRHRNQNSLTHEQVQRATTTVFKSGQNYFMPLPWGPSYLFFDPFYRHGLSIKYLLYAGPRVWLYRLKETKKRKCVAEVHVGNSSWSRSRKLGVRVHAFDPALERQGQADLDYIARPVSKKQRRSICWAYLCGKWDEGGTVYRYHTPLLHLQANPVSRQCRAQGKPMGLLSVQLGKSKSGQLHGSLHHHGHAVPPNCAASISQGSWLCKVTAVCPETYIQLLVSAHSTKDRVCK